MKLIFNKNIEGHKEFNEEYYNKYSNNEFNLKARKFITDDMIYNFVKLFIHKDNTFQAVPKCTKLQTGYSEHVKSYKNFMIDKENQILVIIE